MDRDLWIACALALALATGTTVAQEKAEDKALLVVPEEEGEAGIGGKPVPPEFQEAVRAYQDGDYAGAMNRWSALADKDYAPAQFNLGVMYETGRGAGINYQRAAEFYEKASEQDIPNAYLNLGLLYARGAGVEKDDEMAAELFEAAAELDLPEAQFNIGIAYLTGRGVDKDEAEAAIGSWRPPKPDIGRPSTTWPGSTTAVWVSIGTSPRPRAGTKRRPTAVIR